MAPMAARLAELIGQPVATSTDCIGPEAEASINKLKGGDILMLENVRFYKDEEKNKPEFSEKLGKGMDVYVNDAFGTAHRAHSSTAGVASYVPQKVAGFLLEKEIKFLKIGILKRIKA